MENNPPLLVGSRLRHRSSPMRALPHSKSSPPKRGATRVLSPQHNNMAAPTDSDDLFKTGLLTPQYSQNTVGSDAARSLISPPPEDTVRTGTSLQSSLLWNRAGSEPASNPRHVANASPSSKRKRPPFPSFSLQGVDDLNQSHRKVEASPNPKSRKQTRRIRIGSDEEDDASGSRHITLTVSPIKRRQRQSHAPPPECLDLFRRSHSPSISPNKSRRDPTLLRSPHADNDKADYIRPVLSHTRQQLSARARSSTPIPPYEPPAERFTPPREVFRSSPRVSKSSKRKALRVTIKKEPPEIDLSCLPPPSPTDDPLLLHGRLPCPHPSLPKHARETPLLESTPPGPGGQISPLNRSALDFPLPGIPSDVDDNEDLDLPEKAVFNFTGIGDDSWSSSEGGASEQEGEYTGKFRVVKIPTKADPPTSTTRERIEQWGRPISPFPFEGSAIPRNDADNEGDETSDLDHPLAQPQFDNEQSGRRHVLETSKDDQGSGNQMEAHQAQFNDTELSETGETVPTEEERVKPTNHLEPTRSDHEGRHEEHEVFWGSPAYPQEDAEAHLAHGDENASEGGITPAQRDETILIPEVHIVTPLRENFVFAPASDVHRDDGQNDPAGEVQTEEDVVDRALSEAEEPRSIVPPERQISRSQLPEERVEVDGRVVETVDVEYEGDSSDESDLSVVKIVSDDPWAAARAAAILKQHDWDLVTKISRQHRPSRTVESLIRKARRADLASAGVSKSLSPARSTRRSFGVVVDGRVVMDGSPSMTLPELLHVAESHLDSATFSMPGQQAFRTPSPAPGSIRRPEAPLVIDTDGPREWSRSDWKLLDACFTDARLEVGARWGPEGTLGDVDAVELEDVVGRFVDIFGGEDVISSLGPAFQREDLLKRTKALQRKQRAGEGAPPTPTLRVSSVSSSTPTVPDFTPVHPARRQGVNITPLKLAAPAFHVQTTPRLPASLMAPRYSHLLEEAKSLSKQDGSRPHAPGESPVPLALPSDDGPLATMTLYAVPDHSVKEVPPTPSVGSRMKGFLFSYLPTLKKKPAKKMHEPARPGLPLPPPELIEKPRGPVITPQPKPAPRMVHPKELVHLQHAPPPSRIPTLPRVPVRLVELRPVSPPSETVGSIKVSERRRDSGGSVKDLVNSFEEMDRSSEIEAHALELRRQKSARRLAAGATTTVTNNKPAWR
ncbi:hypothetical protein B0F90DRAFT_1702906 [Multifurca ochricompacta]|uniref:Uncharacterized protein n=1 Tax=Multifurca ochricompacta TaxID=376703 RepID=A0AAD4M872_9AGAM|nr:hypothetical protein B0F90DRAFT_1702906 [Multifurca ochricompacta]